MSRTLLLVFISIVSLYGQKNLNYAVGDVHTLTIPKNDLLISLSSYLMNDTIDVLDIKESELGNNSKFDAIGDLDGYGLKFRYGIDDDLMVNLSLENHNIQYSSNKLQNINTNMFFRYNIIQNPYSFFNSGVSMDLGYVTNKLDDFYLYDLEQINDLGTRYFPNSSNLKLQNSIIGGIEIIDNTTGAPSPLIDIPWVALKDTRDKSQYLRLLTGFYKDKSVMDFYAGIKKTKIKNFITANDELIQKALAQTNPVDLAFSLDRSETMYFAGLNYSYEKNKYIYEFGFEYDKFTRDSGLDYIDFNYIFDASITKYINKRFSIFAGGRIMYRQFNGQIPYLYNKYSQTSYDHKYGYAHAGVQFRF